MRLKVAEKRVFLQAVHSVDPDAKVYLFGSRVDDSAKGGDIDLLVFSDKITYEDKLAVKKAIFSCLDEQKIDLVSFTFNEEDSFKSLILSEPNIEF